MAKKRPKQGHFPGMEPPSVPAIDKAADALVEIRDAWQEMGVKLRQRQADLMSLMQEHKLETYQYDGRGGPKTVTLVKSDLKVKVKALKIQEGEDDD